MAVRLGRRRAGVAPPGLPAARDLDGHHATACHAPSLQLVLLPNGDVGPCCRNPRAFGNISDRLLSKVWHEARRRDLVDRLAEHDYGDGCESCGVESTLMPRSASYVAQFDYWAEHLRPSVESSWPLRIEFDLSNNCNLQCVQCHGDLSSAIRIHREKRAPMPKVYTDEFFEDLRQFIPHLRSAGFAGGEPFLAREAFRVWELCAELAPGLPCTIVTNGTQWNRRVEAVLADLQVQPVLSLDGLTRATYESIRIGADHAQVLANLERFRRYAEQIGTRMNINFCVMVQNVSELPDLLLFAEERGIIVNALTVLGPPECSLAHLPPAELARAHDRLRARSDEVAGLDLNGPTWHTVLTRLDSWRADDPGESRTAWVERSPAILQFPRQGSGPNDDESVRRRLAAMATDGRVHVVRVGPDQVARGWSQDLADHLGVPLEALEGRPLSSVLSVVDRMEVVADDDDRYEATFDVGDRRSGWADQVHVLYAVGQR